MGMTTKIVLIFGPEFRISLGRNATNLRTVAIKRECGGRAVAESAWDSIIALGG
jgi:hypothetical protein